MNQAKSEEEETERKIDKKDRGQEADGKKGSPTKQKHIGGTKTIKAYLGTANFNKVGGGTVHKNEINKFPVVIATACYFENLIRV